MKYYPPSPSPSIRLPRTPVPVLRLPPAGLPLGSRTN